MQESYHKEIVLSDISAQAFEGKIFIRISYLTQSIALIEYLYKGTLPSSQDILKELIVYSEKILLKRLRLHCERTLINQVNKENAAELYTLSKVSGAEDLRGAALRLMGNYLSYFADELASVLTKQSNKKDE